MLLRLKRTLKIRTRWRGFRALIRGLGARATLVSFVHEQFGLKPGSEYAIRPRRALHPLWVRQGTSDPYVMQQVFVGLEYACLDDVPDVGLVVDCGANVGYTSAYFLSRFPDCHVIAVEPDPGNFAQLERNLAAYGDRVTLIRAGVWSHATPLVLERAAYRDGREWSKQVRPSLPDEAPEFHGVDVGSLLAASGHDRISILKVDVEGAEAVIFGEGSRAWLDHVDAIAVELHDDSSFGHASAIFSAAIADRGFQLSRSGELTVCRRPARYQ